MYKYRVVKVEDDRGLEEALDTYGNAGWRLAATIPLSYDWSLVKLIFERGADD